MRLPASDPAIASIDARRLLGTGGRLALRILIGSVLALCMGHAAAQVREGEQAPSIRAHLLGGGEFDSASRRGKVIVLNFWASWCKPCREEMPALETFYRAHRSEGLEVIAVSVEEASDLSKVRDVMKKFSFPAALASASQTEGYGRPWRIPVTYVVDRNGVLRFDGSKFAKTLDLRSLERIVGPLLRQRPGSA